jgi:DnaK suppressor protein
MDKKQKQEITGLYQKELKDILSQINRNNDEIDVSGDEIDQIQGKNIADIQESLSTRDVLKYTKIKNSLSKVKNGTFGKCDECGEDIGYKRMKMLPGVSLCISCAEEAEFLKNRK